MASPAGAPQVTPDPNAAVPTALILGASGTLGGAIAVELAKRSYRLGLHAHQHPERLHSLIASFPNSTLHKPFVADFRVPAQIDTLAKDFLASFGRLDALVWAAGITHDAPVLTQSEADVRETLSVDLTAPWLLSKAIARQFLKQKSGSVVFMSSHAAHSGRAGGAAYAMAQSGLLALMKSLAREWGPTGVRVNAVVPPFVPDSGMGRAASDGFAEAIKRKSVLKSAGEPAQAVASFIGELLSNKTASGQVFTLDARVI